jgi:ketosteroid isomerase-like protein
MSVEDVRKAVEAAGKQHYAAASACDTTAIDELLCDDVVYSHSNALRDDKSGYLDKVASGLYRTLEIDHSVDHVWDLGDVAVVAGTQISSGAVGSGTMDRTESKSLDVWCRRDGRWQLLAHHMTLVR